MTTMKLSGVSTTAQRFVAPFLLVAVLGCEPDRPRLPPTEVQPQIELVQRVVSENDFLIAGELTVEALTVLDRTIAGLESQFGSHSPEVIQGLIKTSSLLASNDHPVAARRYMERALLLNRELYGLEHRETAYTLHDVAILLTMETPDIYLQRAELLFRGALGVRRKILGADDPEAAASEVQLAWQLLLAASKTALAYRKQELLAESEQLAAHAREVFTRNNDTSYQKRIRRILLETAFARGDFFRVEEIGQDMVAQGGYEKGPGLYPDMVAEDLLVRAAEQIDRLVVSRP